MDRDFVTRRASGLSGLMLILLSASLSAQPEGVLRPGILYLKNGDFVSGRIDSSDVAEEIRWKSPLFEPAIQFDVRGVSHISYAPPQRNASLAVKPSNPLARGFIKMLEQLPPAPLSEVPGPRIELVDGQVLYGNVISLDQDALIVDSQRHGSLRIERQALADMDGFAGTPSLMFDGSGNLTLWSMLGDDSNSSDWQSLGRDLLTTQTGANLYYQAPEVGRYVYEITLAGRDAPQFQLAFGVSHSLNDIKNAFSLETWGGKLVIHRQAGHDLHHVELADVQLDKTDWTITLEIYCDPAASRLLVASRGKLLGELETPDQPQLTGRGLLIRNRGTDLRVRHARVRQWRGPMRQTLDNVQDDIVVLTDGKWLTGTVRSLNAAEDQLLLETPQGPKTLSLKQIDRLRFHRSPVAVASPPMPDNLEIAYMDGGMLRGNYLRTDADGLWIHTTFSAQPVLAGWQNLLEVRPLSAVTPDQPLAKNGLVEHAGCRLHGRVVNGEGPAHLRWEPVYSLDPVTFLMSRTTRVRFEPRTHQLSPDQLTSELALINGDVIPCVVETIDETTVTARFPAGEIAQIPREHFKALRDYRPENHVYGAFHRGDHWYANHSDSDMFQLDNGTLELSGDILLAREFELPDRFRIHFDLRFLADAAFVVGVGSDTIENALDRPQGRAINEEMLKEAAKQQPDNLIEFTLTRNASQISTSGTSRVAGLLGMMFRANVFGVRSNDKASVTIDDDTPLHVELLVDRPAREYVILGNGREMYRWRDPTPLDGKCLHLGLGLPVQQRRPAGTAATNPPRVEIYNFGIERWPGLLADDHRERFLTRRLGASPKALTDALRAVNGDSLRGSLVSMRDDSINFQSRLVTLSIPRSSVVELISLQPSDAAPLVEDEGNEAPPAQIRLRRGGVVTLYDLRASDDFVLGRSALAGEVSVPWAAVAMIEFGTSTRTDPPFADWVLRDPPPLPTAEPNEPSPVAAWLGKPAPDFQISVLDGPAISLADLRGRPVIIDFWATWCGPCIASMPTLMQVAEAYEGKVAFIAINQQEDPAEVREFVNSRLWNLRVGLDQDGSLNRLFGINAIPCTIIIDGEGIVRHVHIGATPDLEAELSAAIDSILNSP